MGAACAAITLDRRGGGVAVVSRLIWQAMQARWGDEARLVTLVDTYGSGPVTPPGFLPRLRFGARLAQLQAAERCSWVVCTHLSAAVAQSCVPGPVRQPYAVFLHGVEAWGALTRRQTRALRRAALIMTNSAYTAQRVAARHPWMGSMSPCGLALPPGDTRPRPNAPQSTHDGRTVLVVGRMDAAEQYKGHDQLLEAWPAVRARVAGARLVIAGTGDDLPRLKDKAAALGLGDGVRFAGFVSDEGLEALYDEAALFAMPSRNEGFGLVYLEAMSHGLPCVGALQDAAGEVIEDGATGFLVDQADTGSLADRIGTLLTDESLRRRMGEAGRERVRHAFSYERFERRFSSLLSDAMGSAAALHPRPVTSSR